MTTLTSTATGFITADDLSALDANLDKVSLLPAGPALLAGPTAGLSTQRAPPALKQRSSSRRGKCAHSVSFSPVVRSFTCAPDGERDQALVQAQAQAQACGARGSLPRLQVKTYTLEGIRAWGRMTPSWEDKARVGRMSIRLPGLSRRSRSRSQSAADSSRGILKRRDSDDKDEDEDEDEDDDDLPELAHSPMSSPPMSPLSTSPPDLQTCPLAQASVLPSAAHLQIGTQVPLRTCCIRCERAVDYGLNSDAYKEKFTAGAKRLRAAEERRLAEEADLQAEKGFTRSSGPGGCTASQQAVLDKLLAWEKQVQQETKLDTLACAPTPAVVPFAKGRKVAVDELVTAKRGARQEARQAEDEMCREWCADPEQTIGFDVLERRGAPGSPTVELPSSPLPAPLSPTLATLHEASTQPAQSARPPPPARNHSSADDILPQAQSNKTAPPPPKRKFSLSLFGAFGDAAGGRSF